MIEFKIKIEISTKSFDIPSSTKLLLELFHTSIIQYVTKNQVFLEFRRILNLRCSKS